MKNILIADSGSTKTAWAFVQKEKIGEFETEGINPYYQNEESIEQTILQVKKHLNDTPSEIYFYGAGCSNENNKEKVKNVFHSIFENSTAKVAEDMIGAAKAVCKEQKGIVCILGTGSNACVYNGEKITKQASSLGFWLGDEGSGGNIGKNLIVKILQEEAPTHIISLFKSNYNLSLEEVLEVAYRKPFPNRFFAKFSHFVRENMEEPFLRNLVKESIELFIKRYVVRMKEDLPINFVGSIAFYFQNILKEVLHENQLTLGSILQKPIEGLIEYHK